MQTDKTTKRIKFLVDAFYIAVILALCFVFFKYLFIWLLPFIIGLAITLTVEPVTKLLCEKLRFRRSVSGTITVLAFWGVLSFLLFKLTMVILDELKALTASLPSIFAKAPILINDILDKYKNIIDGLPEPLRKNADSITETIKTSLDPLSKSVTGFFVGTVSYLVTELPNFMIFLAVSLVASTFIAADLPKISRFIMAQVPIAKRQALRTAKNFLFVAIFKFLKAQIILIFITFCELSVAFSILRVQYAILIASIISLVDVLPIIGTNTVVIPWGIFEILSGNTTKGVILIFISIGVSVIRQFIEPRIVGHHLGLYPLVTLISVYVGLQLFGLPGLFILPLTLMLFKHMQETGYLKIWNVPKNEPKGNNIPE